MAVGLENTAVANLCRPFLDLRERPLRRSGFSRNATEGVPYSDIAVAGLSRYWFLLGRGIFSTGIFSD
jgi:hypothetical protein